MKKMRIAIGIGLLTLLVIAAVGFLILRRQAQTQVMDGDGMVYEPEIRLLTYVRGGGELGEKYALSLYENDITREICAGNGQKTESDARPVGSAVYHDLYHIVEEYGMRDWNELPPEELIAADEESVSVSITFRDGESVRFGSGDVLPENGWDGVNALVERLEEEFEE